MRAQNDNTITCWGYNDWGQTDAPHGTFNAVSAGFWHSCGLRTDNTITCWDRNTNGHAFDAPDGTFNAVSAGFLHSCRLRTDNTITCWGDHWGGHDWGQTDAPHGTFNAVSGGLWHSCGLRTDNTITCWGNNDWGQTDAPHGTFNAISAGVWHTCGLRTDNTITCWGNSHHGQADVPYATSATAPQALGVGASRDSGAAPAAAATDAGLWELDDRYEWCTGIQATWEQASAEAAAEGRDFTVRDAIIILRPEFQGKPDVMHIVAVESFRSALKFAVDAAQAAFDMGGGEDYEAFGEFFVEAFRESCAAGS